MKFDNFCEVAAKEVSDGAMQKGLFARIYAECDGDPAKTQARYVRARAEQLFVEQAEEEELLNRPFPISRDIRFGCWLGSCFFRLRHVCLSFGTSTPCSKLKL